ncbi:e3 ubiquitin-protein ligase siah2 [Holotrichia oblita]|uniref:E3 ubiquitin-protein ligase siah2 n=1 Tax=Holotrichia oblita TaxID=644536 RepID=A0ACB9SMK0_HOLOL|nr:e3 ubiquitin-protein ligase siah2 [Holotrichia oblita]
MDHFTEYHSPQVYASDNDCINLPYNITDDTLNEFYILAFDDDNILLNLKVKDDETYFLMYYIGNVEDMRKLVCNVEHRNDDICDNEKTCIILHEKELGTLRDEDEHATSFEKRILETYFGPDVNARITLKKPISKLSGDDILLRLECPICSNFMKTNIKVCTSGHSVCHECEYKLDGCPLCALPFYGARNFALESIGDLLKSLVRSERVDCPLRNELRCLWKGSQSDVVEHVKDYHSNKMVIDKTLMRVLSYATEFSDMNYLMTCGQIFKITCKKGEGDDCMSIIIELIGYDEDAQRYYYNICFNSLYKQSLIWYLKSKVLSRRRVEYYVDYIALSRIVCNKQFNISYTITRNKHR